MTRLKSLLILPLLAACATQPQAAPPETSIAAAGTECPRLSAEASAFMDGVVRDMLDPSSGFSHLAIRGEPALKEVQELERARLRTDWANLCQFKEDNAKIAAGPPPKVVFMGDSITQFWSAGDPELFGPGVVNRGISGQTTSQMVLRFWQDVVALKPRAVHIMAGTNDLAENTGYVSDEAYKANIRAMVTMARENNIAVILASIPPADTFGWRPSLKPAERIEVLNSWLKSYAAETGSIYADYHSLLTDDGSRMAAQFTPDGVHPNAPGYAAMQAAAMTAIAEAKRENWVASWTSSVSTMMAASPSPSGRKLPQLEGTVRYFMRVSAGGDRVRVVIDGGPSISRLAIGAATVALSDGETIDESTIRRLTFSGEEGTLSLSAGAPIWSDPADLNIPGGAILAVSLHLPEAVTVPSADPQLVAYVAPGNDATGAASLEHATRLVARPLVTAIHVQNPDVDRVVVAFGDSITDGMGSKDPLMRGWPDFLAKRMRDSGINHIAIVNQGIGGNRLLQDSVGPSALARFDREVLSIPGVTDVIILEGINDLGLSGLAPWGRPEPFPTLTAKDFIAAYQQMIDRAHAHGIRAIGATLTPDLGSPFPGYATEEKDIIRNEINEWIRTSGAFDAVIDFDAAVRDPEDPKYLAAKYDAGDRLHPSDAGYKAMADAIDLNIFR
jgi:lysophospholipase L1-like esterase